MCVVVSGVGGRGSWPTVSRLSALSQSQHNRFQCHRWGMLRLKVTCTISCTQYNYYETDHDLLDTHRIVRGVNNLGIEDTCDWAVPKHSW